MLLVILVTNGDVDRGYYVFILASNLFILHLRNTDAFTCPIIQEHSIMSILC